MKRFECKNCGHFRCVVFGTEVLSNESFECKETIFKTKWYEIAEEEEKTEEKAEELPSWCKVGELVYFTQTSDYGEVVEVDIEKGVTIKTDICNGWVNFYDLQEARIRPFNESEMRELVGKAITSKITETSYLIVRSDPYCVSAAGDLYCNERLLELFTFTNGQPCGVYEHKENGEWIE